MKQIFKYLFFTFIFFALITCKKYDEGGFLKQTRIHLFGGTKVGSKKTWKLKLYEVNGIDSTMLIQGANTIPDFYDKCITFTYDGGKNSRYLAEMFMYKYRGGYSYLKTEENISFATYSLTDTLRCKTLNNSNYCNREIFKPEKINQSYIWKIKKLTRKEFIITYNSINSYKIILTQ